MGATFKEMTQMRHFNRNLKYSTTILKSDYCKTVNLQQKAALLSVTKIEIHTYEHTFTYYPFDFFV